MLALSMILLIAPAAFHRLAFNGEDAPAVHRVGSILVTAAVGVLAIALTADVMVAIGALTGRMGVGVVAAVSVLLMLVGLWYAWPLALRGDRCGGARPNFALPARLLCSRTTPPRGAGGRDRGPPHSVIADVQRTPSMRT